MTTVYGNQIEPGGMELYNDACQCDCPECGSAEAFQRNWEQNDGGCINQYQRLSCHACGYSKGNNDTYEDFDYSVNLEEDLAMEKAWLAAERKMRLNPMYWIKSFVQSVKGRIYFLRCKVKGLAISASERMPDKYDLATLKIKLECKFKVAVIKWKYRAEFLTLPVRNFVKYDFHWFCKRAIWKIRMMPKYIMLFPFWLIKVVVVALVPKQMLRNFGAWVLKRPWVRRKLREIYMPQQTSALAG